MPTTIKLQLDLDLTDEDKHLAMLMIQDAMYEFNANRKFHVIDAQLYVARRYPDMSADFVNRKIEQVRKLCRLAQAIHHASFDGLSFE